MHFSWEVNAGNIVTILVLVITLFSKSGRWFLSVDKKLDEISLSYKRLSREVERNGRNSNTLREFLESFTRILSSKYPDTDFHGLKWDDGSNKSESD